MKEVPHDNLLLILYILVFLFSMLMCSIVLFFLNQIAQEIVNKDNEAKAIAQAQEDLPDMGFYVINETTPLEGEPIPERVDFMFKQLSEHIGRSQN